MMKSTVTKLAFLLVVAVSFTACNKYEEGANYSLLSAKARLVNSWKMTKVSITIGSTTTDVTSSFPTLDIKLSKDETFEATTTFLGITSVETGTWEFNNDKTTITTTDDDGDAETYTIVKLKNKELKVTQVDGSTTYTYEYEEEV
jgi:hypothetical protein